MFPQAPKTFTEYVICAKDFDRCGGFKEEQHCCSSIAKMGCTLWEYQGTRAKKVFEGAREGIIEWHLSYVIAR